MTSRTTKWLFGALVVVGCETPQPCAQDELQSAAATVATVRDGYPLRIGAPDRFLPQVAFAAEIAGESITAACPRFPVMGLGPSSMPKTLSKTPSPETRRHLAALEQTCPELDDVMEKRPPADTAGDRVEFATMLYEACKLDRFGLVDPLRFALTEDGLAAVAVYDHLLRRGVEPTLAGQLADEMFWASPWPFSAELRAGLPSMLEYDLFAGGIGMRITREGITVAANEAVLPPTAVSEALRRVQPQLAAWSSVRVPAPLVLVADADVSVATIAAIASAAPEFDAGEVVALVQHPHSVRSVPLVSSRPDDQPFARDVCIDATGAWWSPWDAESRGILPPAFVQKRWQPLPPADPRDSEAWQGIADVTVVSSVTLPRLLVALDGIHGESDEGKRVRTVGRITVVREDGGCDAWLAVLEAARMDAKALESKWLPCNAALDNPSRKRARYVAECTKDVCAHARAHVEQFPDVPDVADRTRNAEGLCRTAPSPAKR